MENTTASSIREARKLLGEGSVAEAFWLLDDTIRNDDRRELIRLRAEIKKTISSMPVQYMKKLMSIFNEYIPEENIQTANSIEKTKKQSDEEIRKAELVSAAKQIKFITALMKHPQNTAAAFEETVQLLSSLSAETLENEGDSVSGLTALFLKKKRKFLLDIIEEKIRPPQVQNHEEDIENEDLDFSLIIDEVFECLKEPDGLNHAYELLCDMLNAFTLEEIEELRLKIDRLVSRFKGKEKSELEKLLLRRTGRVSIKIPSRKTVVTDTKTDVIYTKTDVIYTKKDVIKPAFVSDPVGKPDIEKQADLTPVLSEPHEPALSEIFIPVISAIPELPEPQPIEFIEELVEDIQIKPVIILNTFILTNHARSRIARRGISLDDLEMGLTYGRNRHDRGAQFYIVGRKEIKMYGTEEKKLYKLEGLHVVCTNANIVLTAYRNKRT